MKRVTRSHDSESPPQKGSLLHPGDATQQDHLGKTYSRSEVLRGYEGVFKVRHLIKYEEACVAISECHTMSELKEWNERLKEVLEIANYKQDIGAVEDAVKIAMQINIRMRQLLLIQSELIQEMINEI